MEVLLAIVQENAASVSPGSRTAESSLALLLLADLAAGSESAKVRRNGDTREVGWYVVGGYSPAECPPPRGKFSGTFRVVFGDRF